VVFALVKVRDEEVEDGGILLWKVNSLCPCLHEVAAEGPLKVFGLDEDVFVDLFGVLGRLASWPRMGQTNIERLLVRLHANMQRDDW
jgi:hypothetical protein